MAESIPTVDVRWVEDRGLIFISADDLCQLIRDAVAQAKSDKARQAALSIADVIDNLRREAQNDLGT